MLRHQATMCLAKWLPVRVGIGIDMKARRLIRLWGMKSPEESNFLGRKEGFCITSVHVTALHSAMWLAYFMFMSVNGDIL